MDIKFDLGVEDLKKDLKEEVKKHLPKNKEGKVSKTKLCSYGIIGFTLIGICCGFGAEIGHNLADLCFGK
jgi:hypothetical protein